LIWRLKCIYYLICQQKGHCCMRTANHKRSNTRFWTHANWRWPRIKIFHLLLVNWFSRLMYFSFSFFLRPAQSFTHGMHVTLSRFNLFSNWVVINLEYQNPYNHNSFKNHQPHHLRSSPHCSNKICTKKPHHN
jgi:hypothetical protein